VDEYLAANRALWDEWTAVHERSAFYDLDGFRRGGIRIADHEREEIGPVAGQSLLHLQCHFGIDTLSVQPRRTAVPLAVTMSIEPP
jgi:hypothetical protein